MVRSSDRVAEDTGVERVIVNIHGLDELVAIREALDGVRQDIDWWINNHRPEQWLPVQPVTTVPANLLAPTRDDRSSNLPAARELARVSPTPPPPQTATAPNDSPNEETQFCCEAPDLQWTGAPLFPGVACMNCGYIVADCGSVVMQPSPEADPDPEPKDQQRALFAEE